MIPILSKAQEKILIPGSNRERPAVYRQKPVPEAETLYYTRENGLGVVRRKRNNNFHLETVIDTKVLEEDSGVGILVV
jgi:hypothetical protein